LCARKADFIEELAKVGVSVTGEPTLMELVGGLSDAVDEHIYQKGGRTDLGEMAQMGAAETLTAVLAERTASLFGVTAEDVPARTRAARHSNEFLRSCAQLLRAPDGTLPDLLPQP